MLLPSHQSRRSSQIADNGRRTCPLANADEVSKYSMRKFSPDHTEDSLDDLLLDGTVNATETFAQLENMRTSLKN